MTNGEGKSGRSENVGLPQAKELIEFLGFDGAAEKMAEYFLGLFAENGLDDRYILQFLREEADAASQGDAKARIFAASLFAKAEDYQGAMEEDALYAIDGPGGPQQMIIAMCLQLGENPELMRNFRCAVVKRIKDDYDSREH